MYGDIWGVKLAPRWSVEELQLFKTRLQGILGGLLDFEATYDWLWFAFRDARVAPVSLSTKYRLTSIRSEKVRLMHATLHQYLKDTL